MNSLDFPITTLEDFPDELLLLICRYLSSTEVLFSFYGLNFRLSRMISDHFKHVVIAQIPYKQFQTICRSVLPQIGSTITSLVLSNQWKGVLSKLFITYFANRMSSICPNLEKLTLISFNDRSLTSFLEILENLRKLHQLQICHMYQISDQTMEKAELLHRIFTANNNRLNSILFDDDSMVFSLPMGMDSISYSNIQRLTVDLNRIEDLHRLLTRLPFLQSMNAAINKDTKELKIGENTPMKNLKQFQLQSFGPSWTLEHLASILVRLPSLEQLSIAIEIYKDVRLMNGEEIHSLISSLSLKNFSYFLRYYDQSTSTIDHLDILPSWHQFNQKLICVKSDDRKMLLLYTLPFISDFLILPNTIATNKIFLEHYAPQVKIFTLSGMATNTTDVFSIIQKCHRLRNLYLRAIDNDPAGKRSIFLFIQRFSCSIVVSSKDILLHQLPYLIKLTALRASSLNDECFQRLLEISPNLYNLEINYDLLRKFFDNQSICHLLKHRITHLYILISSTTDIGLFLSSIEILLEKLPFLRHLYVCFEKVVDACERTILTFLKYLSQWKSLVSFGIVSNELSARTLTDDFPQWIVANSHLHDPNSFSVDCNDDAFRLWL